MLSSLHCIKVQVIQWALHGNFKQVWTSESAAVRHFRHGTEGPVKSGPSTPQGPLHRYTSRERPNSTQRCKRSGLRAPSHWGTALATHWPAACAIKRAKHLQLDHCVLYIVHLPNGTTTHRIHRRNLRPKSHANQLQTHWRFNISIRSYLNPITPSPLVKRILQKETL